MEDQPEFQLKTPVAFIIFKRPDTTEKVFDRIRYAKPPKLLVIADGPRPDVPGEAEKCAAARAVVEKVDWPCEVMTNYSEINLGCDPRVASGLDWVFDIVEEAIILEDDCLPDLTFFRFCEELLERFRDDERIMTISGYNFQFGRKRTGYSYYFSKYSHIGAWATWRRAWKHFDMNMTLWPEIRDGGWVNSLFRNKAALIHRITILEKDYHDEFNTWDSAWLLSCWIQNALTVLPNVNLILHIGFGEGKTHTFGGKFGRKFANMKKEPMTFPLRHPRYVMRDMVADEFSEKNNFYVPPFYYNPLVRVLVKMYRRIRSRFLGKK